MDAQHEDVVYAQMMAKILDENRSALFGATPDGIWIHCPGNMVPVIYARPRPKVDVLVSAEPV